MSNGRDQRIPDFGQFGVSDATFVDLLIGYVVSANVTKTLRLDRLAGFIARFFGTYVVTDPKYGADNTGATDSTTAINAAIAAAVAAGWGCVVLPLGQYLVSDTLAITGPRVRLIGSGRYVTQFVCNPASAKAITKFQHANTALVLYQCSIQHLSFIGHASASAIQKIAIDAWDTSGLYIHDVSVQTWTGNSGSAATPSTAFRSNGREATTVDFVEFSAERPIHLRANPNSASLDVDSFTFCDCYLTVQGANEAAYEIDSQIGVFNLTIGGRQAWVQGKYGIHWPSVGAMRATAQNVKITNGRFEQATAAGGYAIYWTGGTNNLTLDNCGMGGVTLANTGLYVRNVVFPHLISCSYPGTGVTIDADGTTINTLRMESCYWAAGSTATLTGFTQVYAEPKTVSGAPLPPTASYVSTSAATLPAVKILGTSFDNKEGTLANGGTVTLYFSATGATKIARVEVDVAEQGGGHLRRGGTFTVGDNGATVRGATANVSVGNVPGDLCLLYNSINSIQVYNATGVAVDYIITTFYRPG